MASAAPQDLAGFRGPARTVYQGVCQVILRPSGRPGTISLTLSADGLPPASITVTARQ